MRPAVILVRPQLGENIGAAARAMLNCGLTELRLVAPRDGWPSETALASSSGATRVIEEARLFDTTEAAIGDLTRLYATTARPRDLATRVVDPRQAALEMTREAPDGLRPGILFGAERTGLVNEDVVLADAIIEAPLNPGFRSLNIAQAVLLVAWEWWMATGAEAAPDEDWQPSPPRTPAFTDPHPPADKADMLHLFKRLEGDLEEGGFFSPAEKAPGMIRNLRTLLTRMQPNKGEVQMLHGVIRCLKRMK